MVEDEVRALGFKATPEQGGISFQGPEGSLRRANLWLRTANRVLLRLGVFPASDDQAFLKGVRAIPFARYLNLNSGLDLDVHIHRSALKSGKVTALTRMALKAPPKGQGTPVPLQVRVVDDLCTVSVDTSGELLYRRGYRQEVSHAPMRETLAAGILRLAGYRGEGPLWDPMCGSGTLPIEASWMSCRRAPGLNRTFAFEQWPNFDPALWAAERQAAKAGEASFASASDSPISGSDINGGALGTARRNARRAHLTAEIEWQRQGIATVKPNPGLLPGLLITNPPYGIRVGEKAELQTLYQQLGNTLATSFRGWRAAVLVADPALESYLRLNIETAFPVENGGISCRLLVGRSAISR